MVSPSPSGQRLLLIRCGEAGAEPPAPTKMEIWGAGRLLKEIYVPAAVHGSVYNDNWYPPTLLVWHVLCE